MQFILSKDKIQVECNTKSLLNLYCRKRSNVFPCAAVPTRYRHAIPWTMRLRNIIVKRLKHSNVSLCLRSNRGSPRSYARVGVST